LGNGAHCPCAARHAANGKIFLPDLCNFVFSAKIYFSRKRLLLYLLHRTLPLNARTPNNSFANASPTTTFCTLAKVHFHFRRTHLLCHLLHHTRRSMPAPQKKKRVAPTSGPRSRAASTGTLKPAQQT
jgi:hypothetical protein